MNTMIQLSIAIIAFFIVWRIYKVLKANPGLLSRQNLSKSFTTMAVLALILMGAVAILVLLTR